MSRMQIGGVTRVVVDQDHGTADVHGFDTLGCNARDLRERIETLTKAASLLGMTCRHCEHPSSRHFAEATPPFERGCSVTVCGCRGYEP